MAVRYYDEALLAKISSLVKDPNMRVLGTRDTAALFNMYNVQNDDSPITFPLITLSRNDSVDILSTTKRPLTFDGLLYDSDGKKSRSINAIPIGLKYDIDIYCRYADEVDEYARNFIFSLINHPKLSINIPYNNLNLEHISNISLLTPITYNSDVPQRLANDQFSRVTIPIEIDDAYLFSVPMATNWVFEEPDEVQTN